MPGRFSVVVVVLVLGSARVLRGAPDGPARLAMGADGEDLVVVHLGDSITITSYLEPEQRIEAALKPMLPALFAGRSIRQHNLGRDGEDVKQFLEERYEQVLKRELSEASVFIIRYGTNDQHHYDTEAFRGYLEDLLDRLGKDYPGALLVLGTGPYLGGSTWINEHQYAPNWQIIREVAQGRALPLVDVFERFKEEYEKHDRFLCRKKGDMHPSAEGVKVTAQEVLRTLGRAFASAASDLSLIEPSQGATILLLGDSISAMHRGEHRLEVVLARRLREAHPDGDWTLVNESRGGEWIGPGEQSSGAGTPLFGTETTGRYFNIRERTPRADVVFVEYGSNDSKCYPPDVFRRRLLDLCTRLRTDYPGVRIVLATGMYLDYPNHARPYWRDDPQVPGWTPGSTSRNEYLEPYFSAVREVARAEGHGLADVCLSARAETAAGNWDLRIRNWPEREQPEEAGPPVSAEVDRAHEHLLNWFDNVHPNYAGTELIAQVYADVLADIVRPAEATQGGKK